MSEIIEILETIPMDIKYISILQHQNRDLRLQLSRAKEWMQHGLYCKMRSSMPLEIGRTYTAPKDFDEWRDSQPCTCGLTEFLKEVGGE